MLVMQWWRYDPDRSRWLKCSESQARDLIALEQRMGQSGEAKVACVDERLDLELIAKMRDPVLYMGSKALAVIRSQIVNSPTLFALLGGGGGGIKLFVSDYIEPEAVYIIDQAGLTPDPRWPLR
jgi:hypothetical protein